MEPGAVLIALGLRDLGAVSWRAAVDLAYLTDDRLLLTPPVPGVGGRWVLLAGRWLLRPQSTMDSEDGPTRPDPAELSDRLGTEVQRLSTYRSGELHGWERAVDGLLTRAFAYAGQTVTRWMGPPDAVERAAGLPPTLDDPDDLLIGERDVLRVAAGWSVDPSRLPGLTIPGHPRAAAT